MSTTIPVRDLSIEDRARFRKDVIEAGHMAMQRKGIIPLHDAISRTVSTLDLAPAHLGLTSWATPDLTADTWVPWVNFTHSQTASVLLIYKVLQLSSRPTVVSIRFKRPSAVLGIHELECCYSGLPIIENLATLAMSPTAKEVLDRLSGREAEVSPDFGSPMEAYFSEAYIIEPHDTFRIELKSREDSPGDYLVLGGYSLERRGLTIV